MTPSIPDALPEPAPEGGVAAAWRRLWGRPPSSEPAADYWTSGVTYRGYLGVDGVASASWSTEQQMKETQALLRMAAAVGRLGAWAIELPHHRWLWSDEVKAIHGVPPGFVPTSTAVLPLYTEESRGLLEQALEQCMERGVPFDLELQLQGAVGRPAAWIHVLGDADHDAEGRITHVRGAMQDISRFRSVTDEARRTAERFTRTLEWLPDGFVLLDHEWRFIYLNPAAERILRRSRHQLTGRCLLTEYPETAAGRFLERCENAARDGTSVEFEKFYPPLGIWMRMKVSPSDLGLTLCIHDDTERINARRELLTLRAQLGALKAAATP